ncbi:hypothetical protein BT67DRAFT_441822 [Trichocladium antarcticum]|uniref:Uncharacterized protein n=1 Tax=Trichocladium antarcticum TaxID=1450529 RepID=A0AAN6UL75_9PEZI|nr:hypothetical protein BT67DRAFT_441822 [Trichocladium antarcticum]
MWGTLNPNPDKNTPLFSLFRSDPSIQLTTQSNLSISPASTAPTATTATTATARSGCRRRR